MSKQKMQRYNNHTYTHGISTDLDAFDMRAGQRQHLQRGADGGYERRGD